MPNKQTPKQLPRDIARELDEVLATMPAVTPKEVAADPIRKALKRMGDSRGKPGTPKAP